MSNTAIILTISVERRDQLVAQHGLGAERALYAMAARLIAGNYVD